MTVPKGIDVSEVRITVTTRLGTFPSSNTGVSPFRAPIVVDTNGMFRRDALPLGEYRLLAKHPRCASYRTRFELQEGHGTGPLDVALGSLVTLVVRVLDTAGRGVGGESFVLHRAGGPFHRDYRLEPASPQIAAGLTDGKGKLRFTNLQPGAYTLTRRGIVNEQRDVTVEAGGDTVILFQCGASLLGLLLGQDGEIVPRAKLHFKAPGGSTYETFTDDAGAFAVRDIASAEYKVTVVACEIGVGPILLPGTVVIEDGRTQELALRLPAILLRGKVLHAEDDSPFSSRKVSVTACAVGDRDNHLTFSRFTRTTPDGHFELAGLYPGRYSVQASPVLPDDEYLELARVVVTVAPDPVVQELVLRVPRIARTARLCLRVSDPDGNPASNVWFTIDGLTRMHLANGTWRCRDASVLEPGVYEIRLLPGKRVIRVRTPPPHTEEGRRSLYDGEITVDVASGQTIVKDLALRKLGD